MDFLGFQRTNGSVGIRNHVAVISSGRCANEMAATIADTVPGAVPVIHTHVCVRLKDDNEKEEKYYVSSCNYRSFSCYGFPQAYWPGRTS